MYTKYVKSILMVASAVVMSGCSSMFTVGSSDYGCSGMPEGVQCLSSKEVYALTEQPGPVTGEDYRNYVEGKQATESSANRQTLRTNDPYAQAYREMLQNMPVNQESMPIRTRSQVMRIWIAPWNSTNGDHHQQGLIYTELEGRRWNMGEPGEAPANSIRPLGN